MKSIRLCLSLAMLLSASVVFGQEERTVSAIKAGTVLTDSDIGFLTLVSNASLDVSRGNATREAKVAGTTYKAGHKLTAAQATALKSAIEKFRKSYKAPEGSRGAGLCYYWYYYCDGYGYCYWYKVWYYC